MNQHPGKKEGASEKKFLSAIYLNYLSTRHIASFYVFAHYAATFGGVVEILGLINTQASSVLFSPQLPKNLSIYKINNRYLKHIFGAQIAHHT